MSEMPSHEEVNVQCQGKTVVSKCCSGTVWSVWVIDTSERMFFCHACEKPCETVVVEHSVAVSGQHIGKGTPLPSHPPVEVTLVNR